MALNNRREFMLVLAAIICAGAFATDRYIVPPFIARAARIAKLETSIRNGKQLLARETAMRSRWKAMKAWSLDNYPGARDAESGDTGGAAAIAESNVHEALDRWSRESRLGLTSLKPRWTADEKNYRKLEFNANAEGGLPSVSAFLYQLEREELAIHLESVEISARDSRGQELIMNVDFSGLIFKEE